MSALVFKVDEPCGITGNIHVYKTGITSSMCVFFCFYLCSCCCQLSSQQHFSTAPEHINRYFCLVPDVFLFKLLLAVEQT